MFKRNRCVLFVLLGLFLVACHSRAQQSKALRQRGLFRDVGDILDDIVSGGVKITKKIVDRIVGLGEGIVYFLKTAKSAVFKIGAAVINLPKKAIEYTVGHTTDLSSFGKALAKRIIQDASGILGANWKGVILVNFPGENIAVLSYPTGQLSVVSGFEGTAMHLVGSTINVAQEAAKATFAYMLYASLKLVFSAFHANLSILGDCVSLPKQDIKVNNILFSRIKTGKGRICGIAKLRPSYNVTIIKYDRKFLVIEIPFVLPGLEVHYEQFTTPGLTENEKLAIKINKVEVKSVVEFQSGGSMLKFFRLRIRVTKLGDFKTSFVSKKSYMMKVVDKASSIISSQVMTAVNKVFEKVESKLYSKIGGA